jgi:hypothetical protein
MNSTDLQPALAAIPETAPGIEAHLDAAGTLQVRRAVVPKWCVTQALNRWFCHTDYVQVRLDAQGTFFWHQIDGLRSLEDIACNLAGSLGMAKSDSREAVLVFTKMLMIRQLIRLRVAVPEEHA